MKRFPFILFLFSFLGILPLSAGRVHAATYNTATGSLLLPHLVKDGKHLTGVELKLNPDGTYSVERGVISSLPFICSTTFSLATETLLKAAKTVEEMDLLLGCRSTGKSLHKTKNPFVNIETVTYSWMDSTCQVMLVGIDVVKEELDYASLDVNKPGCALYHPGVFYGLRGNLTPSKITLLQFVRVNDSAVGTDVLIELGADNRYKLLDHTLVPDTAPRYVCDTLTEEKYNLIDPGMTTEAVSQILGCAPFIEITDNSHTWVDHEWNTVTVGAQLKTFAERTVGRIP